MYPQIFSIGTSNPPYKYKQSEISGLFSNVSPKVRELFENSHIKYRYLYLPKTGPDGKIPEENNQELIDKHLRGVLEMGPLAVKKCLLQHDLSITDIDYLVCVSSTGFLCPGISAHLIKEMGFRNDIHRVDILGMGCNAGINALHSATTFAKTNHGRNVLIVCIEVCSAAYVNDGTLKTGIVNSLFGDGAAAVVVSLHHEMRDAQGPSIMGFESLTITENIDLMKFELLNNKLSFFLAKQTPYVIGNNIAKPVNALLGKFGLKKHDIKHWVVHSGGKKVLDSIKYNLDLTSYDIRHTSKILEGYGNISSCSIFFSMESLINEGVVQKGDLSVAIAMGPGTALETVLLRW